MSEPQVSNVRRACMYCNMDMGPALPAEAWAFYPKGTVTSAICDACHEETEHPGRAKWRAIARAIQESGGTLTPYGKSLLGGV